MVVGAALLIASHSGHAAQVNLARRLQRVADALRALGDWQVAHVAVAVGRSEIEHAITELDRGAPIALVVVCGRIIESALGPALTLSPAGAGDAPSVLPLHEVADWFRGGRPPRAVIVLISSSRESAGWLASLDTGRAGDLIMVAAGRAAGPVLEVFEHALQGEAVDLGTGTVTLSSLAAHLASHVDNLQVRQARDDSTLLVPPPLAGPSDPRLTRRSRAAAGAHPAAGAAQLGDTDRRGPVIGATHELAGLVLPGRFRLDRLIATGGFGSVYRARQLTVERDVAVKVLNADIDASSPAGRLFVHEIHSVGRIDHPNVVRIYHADVMPDGRLFFAMELLAGNDLEQIATSEQRISVARSIALTRQLLAGLAAVHDVGLVHADIKPANAIVVPTRDGGERVVLVDFGLSRIQPVEMPARSVGGTPAYMAPEQLRGGRVDARSDLFAAALVLVTLMTGWRRRSIEALVPPLGELVEGTLRDVLDHGLAIDPAARYQTAAEFSAALDAETTSRALAENKVAAVALHDAASVTSDAPAALTDAPLPLLASALQNAVRTARPGKTTATIWRRRARMLTVTGVAIAAVVVAAISVHRDRAGASSASAAAGSVTTTPVLLVGGSGTVLWGMLAPVRDELERRSGVSIPLTSDLDSGTGGAMNLLRKRKADVVGVSARQDRPIPAELRDRGTLVVEVVVGFDETALFVARDNPVRRVDIAAFRRALCCARGADKRAPSWRMLGAVGPLAEQNVRWILYGRNSTPRPGDTSSATLALADTWFCGADQLCAASEPVEVDAHELLNLVPDAPNTLALSSRAFATNAVHAVATIDPSHGARLNGRRPLWLYAAASAGAPLPAKMCRFFAAVLDDEVARRLDVIGKVEALPPALRVRERSALGLDDATCEERVLAAPPDGILRSPLTHDADAVARWVPYPG